MIIVKRVTDAYKLSQLGPPLLIYGRRKTGKTFLMRQLFKGPYYFVRRDGVILSGGEALSYREFLRELGDGAVVDEFHRLPAEFLDWLHANQPSIILVTSTLHLASRILGPGSPILGLFKEYRVGLIDERDILAGLRPHFSNVRELVEAAVFLREPILLRAYSGDIFSALRYLRLAVPALIGEVFAEEEKVFAARYEAVIRSLAAGKSSPTEIAARMYSSGLLPRQDPSLVKPYLAELIKLGLVKKVEVYAKRRYLYLVESPMVDLYYYLDEKYNFSESDLGPEYFKEKLPLYVEDFVRELLAKIHGARPAVSDQIDVLLVKHKRVVAAAEVKWRSHVDREEALEIAERLSKYPRRYLVVPSRDAVEAEPTGVEIVTAGDLVKMAEKSLEPFVN